MIVLAVVSLAWGVLAVYEPHMFMPRHDCDVCEVVCVLLHQCALTVSRR